MEDCLEGRGDLHREVHGVGEDVRVKHVGGLPRPDHQQSVMSSGPAVRHFITKLKLKSFRTFFSSNKSSPSFYFVFEF